MVIKLLRVEYDFSSFKIDIFTSQGLYGFAYLSLSNGIHFVRLGELTETIYDRFHKFFFNLPKQLIIIYLLLYK